MVNGLAHQPDAVAHLPAWAYQALGLGPWGQTTEVEQLLLKRQAPGATQRTQRASKRARSANNS